MSDIEHLVFDMVRNALNAGIVKTLDSGYNQPVTKLVEEVIAKHRAEFVAHIEALVTGALSGAEFDAVVREEFNRKVAKLLITKCSGSIERSVSDVLSDPARRARIVLAVEAIAAEGSR
jgi:hypothetical protein